MKRWGGTDRRAGSRPCGLSLSGCRRISGKTGKTSGKYPALRAGCFPSASPVLPAARNKGIGSDRRAGSRPAVFRLAAVAAYPEERETPGENSQPAADRPPRAFPILPAARNKGIGTVRRAGSRPCGLSLSGCRRISGRTRNAREKQSACGRPSSPGISHSPGCTARSVGKILSLKGDCVKLK